MSKRSADSAPIGVKRYKRSSYMNYEGLVEYINKNHADTGAVATALLDHMELFSEGKDSDAEGEVGTLVDTIFEEFKEPEANSKIVLSILSAFSFISNRKSGVRKEDVEMSSILIILKLDDMIKHDEPGITSWKPITRSQVAQSWIINSGLISFNLAKWTKIFETFDNELRTSSMHPNTIFYIAMNTNPTFLDLEFYLGAKNWEQFEPIFDYFKDTQHVKFLVRLGNALLNGKMSKKQTTEVVQEVVGHVIKHINSFDYESFEAKHTFEEMLKSEFFNVNPSNPFQKTVLDSIGNSLLGLSFTKFKASCIKIVLSSVSIYDMLSNSPDVVNDLKRGFGGNREQQLREFTMMCLCGIPVPKSLESLVKLKSIQKLLDELATEIGTEVTKARQGGFKPDEVYWMIRNKFQIYYEDKTVQDQFDSFLKEFIRYEPQRVQEVTKQMNTMSLAKTPVRPIL